VASRSSHGDGEGYNGEEKDHGLPSHLGLQMEMEKDIRVQIKRLCFAFYDNAN